MKKIRDQLKKLKKNKVFDQRFIIAIGRLEHIGEIQEILTSIGVSLDAIVDNDKKKQGINVKGIQVYSPQELLMPFRNDCLILIYSPKYWREILNQFEQMGYREGIEVIVLQKPDLKNNVKSIVAGYKEYKSLKKEFGDDAVVFICNCPLGDFYLLGLYFKQYIEECHISNYVIVGNSKGISKLSELFQFKNVMQFDSDRTELLTKIFVFMGDVLEIRVLTIWQGALCFNPCIIRRQNPFTFMDTFQYFVYRLGENTHLQLPDFDATINHTYVETIGLVKGKTVILAPYSYSIQSLPMSFWQSLADHLIEQGFCVAVNIDEVKENNLIQNTITLKVPLKESISVIEYAGIIIGIRSGFFDVTSSAKCKRIVLYPKKLEELSAYHWNREDMEFNSLNAMGLCEDAIELEFPTSDNNGKTYINKDRYDIRQSELLIHQILEKII